MLPSTRNKSDCVPFPYLGTILYTPVCFSRPPFQHGTLKETQNENDCPEKARVFVLCLLIQKDIL